MIITPPVKADWRAGLVLGLLAGGLALAMGSCDSAGAAEKRPNIVLIISDDQAYTDFGFMGHPYVRTPHLDRLAAESVQFPNGYVPTAVCRPSLVTLLTGRYPHEHGVTFNHPPPGFAALSRSPEMDKARYDALRSRSDVFIQSVPTLPRLLAEHGYRCLQTGKYWEGHWRNAGFTEGMTTAEATHGARYGNLTLPGGDVVAHGNGDAGLAIGRETLEPIYDFIRDSGEQPFFVWYAPFLPHTPHDSPERFRQLYQDDPRVPAHCVPYYAAISQLDETVGALVRFLDEQGLAERTLLLFVIDNGWVPDPERFTRNRSEWDHTERSKRSPFDHGLRTPILVRWPGELTPARHEALVSSVDVVPTLLEAASIALPPGLPGASLWPAARQGRSLAADRAVFGEIYPGDASVLGRPEADIAYRWVRQGEFKLIVPHRHDGARPWNRYLARPALFNVVDDPDERRDVIDVAEYASVARALRAALDAWWTPDPEVAPVAGETE